ncbi:MAG: hypothetical protein AAF806_12560, partial [Bacteroidota bacterium]
KQARARESREKRNIIIPLVIDSVKIPSFIEDKIYLDISKNYYAGICRLAGVVHRLRSRAIDEGINKINPQKINDCINVLRYGGYEPYIYADKEIIDEILQFGGTPYLNDRVRFNPEKILTCDISPRTRHFVKMAMEAWN